MTVVPVPGGQITTQGLLINEKKHGWNLPEGGTVTCHEATDEQLAARKAAVDKALALRKSPRGTP